MASDSDQEYILYRVETLLSNVYILLNAYYIPFYSTSKGGNYIFNFLFIKQKETL